MVYTGASSREPFSFLQKNQPFTMQPHWGILPSDPRTLAIAAKVTENLCWPCVVVGLVHWQAWICWQALMFHFFFSGTLGSVLCFVFQCQRVFFGKCKPWLCRDLEDRVPFLFVLILWLWFLLAWTILFEQDAGNFLNFTLTCCCCGCSLTNHLVW